MVLTYQSDLGIMKMYTYVIQETHQEMRYPIVTSFYFATNLLRFTSPTEREGFPWDDLRKIMQR